VDMMCGACSGRNWQLNFQGSWALHSYRTSRGDFEALFLTRPRTFDSVRLVERRQNGGYVGYVYSLQGIPPGSYSMHMQCARRTFFARHANRLFIGERMQLAADLGEVLNSI